MIAMAGLEDSSVHIEMMWLWNCSTAQFRRVRSREKADALICSLPVFCSRLVIIIDQVDCLYRSCESLSRSKRATPFCLLCMLTAPMCQARHTW